MNALIPLPAKWAPYLLQHPETGMGYYVATVWLEDGQRFDQVVIDSGFITKVKGYDKIPFDPNYIIKIMVTHEKWDWSKGA